jgi:hypothetical protein
MAAQSLGDLGPNLTDTSSKSNTPKNKGMLTNSEHERCA